MKNGGGEADVLPLPATSFGSATAVAQAVKAYLLQHQDVTAVFTIGNVDANSADERPHPGRQGRAGSAVRHQL